MTIWQYSQWRQQPLPVLIPITYELQKGRGAYHVIAELRELGVLSHATYFRILIELTRNTDRLQAGEYQLNPGLTPTALLTKLVSGEVVQHKVTIVDGITLRELLLQLNNDPRLIRLPLGVDETNISDHLGLSIPFAEGYFLPNTYQFTRGTTVAAMLRRAHEAMAQALADSWQERYEGPLANPEALLTLASIIEKETGKPEDRRQISQVFHRRLELNMRLQTDPTVIYALGSSFDGDLRRRDLAIESPYNTYKVKGLPPTPIALPSIASLLAAAQPESGDYVYFVARGDGGSQFSRTLEEHNAAVRKYQLRAE